MKTGPRALYQSLLWLHPPRFRREFAGEMLWIFEMSATSEGSAGLLSDAFVSLARQWLLRSGAWKIGLALAGAFLQLGIGSIGMLFLTRPGMDGAAAVALRGVWSGNLETRGVETPMELVFSREHGDWVGLVTAGGRTDSIADFRAFQSTIEFRVSSPDGDLLFRGNLAAEKLSGTLRRGGTGIGIFEVARADTGVSAAALDTKRFVGLATVLAAGIILSVVLLALWARSFMWGRLAACGGLATRHARRSTHK